MQRESKGNQKNFSWDQFGQNPLRIVIHTIESKDIFLGEILESLLYINYSIRDF